MGLFRRSKRHTDPFGGAYRSRELPGEVVVEGNPACGHDYQRVEWNYERDGKSIDGLERMGEGEGVQFPMGTFKDLYRCNCGREIIRKTYALL